jgi:hypothetical protein
VHPPPKKNKPAKATSFNVAVTKHQRYLAWAVNATSQSKGLDEGDRIKFPKDFSNPTCIFTKAADWLGNSAAHSSHDTRQQKTAVLCRAIQKIATDHKIQGPYIFAILCGVPWHMWCIAQSLSASGFYVADPVSAREPLAGGGEDAAHILCACVKGDTWFQLRERQRDETERDEEWKLQFRNFESVDLRGFDFASQLTTWFLHRFTRKGDTVWHLNTKKKPHFALSALACGRTVAVTVEEAEEETVTGRLQYAEEYAKQKQMFLDFSAPARVFTILALVQVTTSLDEADDDTSAATLIASSNPVRTTDIIKEHLVKQPSLDKAYIVRESGLRTKTGESIGLGVFTNKAFKKKEIALGVLIVILLSLHNRFRARTVTHVYLYSMQATFQAHLLCEGFQSVGEQGLEEWEGWPWNHSFLPGIKFCSSVPQLFDYINDPANLVHADGTEAKANVRVRINNIMQCPTFHGRTRRSET